MKSFFCVCSTFLLYFQPLSYNSFLLHAETFDDGKLGSSAKKETWQENGTLDLSFVAAKNRLKAKMTTQGYTEVHEIKVKDKNERSLILWKKDSKKIIYMIWKIDIDKTGYSWGVVHENKSK